MFALVPVRGVGSSPHARGAPHDGGAGPFSRRLIPACAGSTRPTAGRSRRRAAHPRMRGEHRHAASPATEVFGSSPHARGAPPSADHRRILDRLIPACAGSTPRVACPMGRGPAHPRMRGEHDRVRVQELRPEGSSPHARGARGPRLVLGHGPRLIPACAGSTAPGSKTIPPATAHPRMRGEHPTRPDPSRHIHGSSPHARGARSQPRRPTGDDRLIPACAGSTPASTPPARGIRAHPRMRGEHREDMSEMRGRLGSSPHARGALRDGHLGPDDGRLIPACAGSTLSSDPPLRERGAHPRMRGEHRRTPCLPALARGSSPHARGARLDDASAPDFLRLIPACAGSTAVGCRSLS